VLKEQQQTWAHAALFIRNFHSQSVARVVVDRDAVAKILPRDSVFDLNFASSEILPSRGVDLFFTLVSFFS